MLLSRREVVLGGMAVLATGLASTRGECAGLFLFCRHADRQWRDLPRHQLQKIAPKWHRQVVKFKSSEPQGTIVVDTRNHFLYLIMENKTAIRYGVGVGKEGFKWYGRSTIDRKALWPKWTPPPEMRKRHPELPESVAGGSPMGACADSVGSARPRHRRSCRGSAQRTPVGLGPARSARRAGSRVARLLRRQPLAPAAPVLLRTARRSRRGRGRTPLVERTGSSPRARRRRPRRAGPRRWPRGYTADRARPPSPVLRALDAGPPRRCTGGSRAGPGSFRTRLAGPRSGGLDSAEAGPADRSTRSDRQALAIGLPPGRTVQVRTRLGLVHERLGDLNDARAAHDAAVADAGASAGAYHERGLFRLRRGDRAGAIADFEEAVRRDPTWPDPRRALAGLGVAQPGASGASPVAPARPD